MGKLEKYSSYKESGVEWLGEIPEYWKILKAKYFHKNLKALNTKRICDNVLSLTLRGVVNNNIDSPEGLVPKDYATYQIFEKDDLVFKLIDLENISTSRVGIVHEKGIMSSAYIRLKTGQNSIPRFAYYYYYSLYINQVYNNIGSGVRSTLGPNDLLNIAYIEPPVDEQSQIVSFLDNKTAQIDNAISQKEKLIELLKEQKQITINEAVTKGLDKDVEFKDSGVEWIGEIPKHWEVFPGLRVFSENKRKNTGMIDDRVLSLSYGRIIRKPKEKLVGLVPESFETYQIVKAGDIIIRCTDLQNDKVSLRTALAKDDGIITSAYLNLNVKNGSSEYWHYLLHVLDITKAIYKLGSGLRQNLSFNDFKRLDIVLPPEEEQIQIVEYIETQTAKIDKAIELQQNYIAKLKEYKASLIDSVVTGKVKV
ncbi:MAG: restriction endonuclease subunit S [Sulfurovum sp.]|nr:restriction endonuclease subunit S [Sulfurovum sp.]MDD3499033.1 restriction endonuclease subunit S [Sulfurovum sp.]